MRNIKTGHVQPIVCLDAGHYGKYNRSPVVKDYYESEMNWKLHNLLAAELEGYGIAVVKTRADQKKDLALKARGKASKGCDLFLSIHSNACDTESVDRPVGIYFVDDNCGGIDDQSKILTQLLVQTVQEVMQTKGKAQTYSKKSSGDRDGDGKKNDDYYGVLFGAHQVGTAGVILEHSFHTNTRAAKWLLEDENLQRMAQAEAAVLAEYFGMTQDTAAVPVAPAEPEKPVEAPEIKVDYAKSKTAAYDASYIVRGTSKGLNLRSGASTNKAVVEVMPEGSTFRCYGYHTGSWLYGISASGKKGFCSKSYLKKV